MNAIKWTARKILGIVMIPIMTFVIGLWILLDWSVGNEEDVKTDWEVYKEQFWKFVK